jgi:hypothetical protein
MMTMKKIILWISTNRFTSINLFLFAVLLAVTAPVAYAQAPAKQWDAAFGGTGEDQLRIIVPAPDGGYLLAGESSSPASGDKTEPNRGGNDFWVVKIDAAGTRVWDKSFGGGGTEYLASAIATSDGGYLLGGTSTSGASGDKSEPSRGDSDIWIVKIDAAGNKLWDKTFGGSNGDGLGSIFQTPEGGYLLGGFSNSPVSGDRTAPFLGGNDAWLIHIDATGNKLWDKAYRQSFYAFAYPLTSLAPSPDGGYLLGGDGNWIIKIDAAGNQLWEKIYRDNSGNWLSTIIPAPDGGYLLAGTTFLEDCEERPYGKDICFELTDFQIIKIDAVGNQVWSKTFGGGAIRGGAEQWLTSAILTADGGYLLAGHSSSTVGEGYRTEPGRGVIDYWLVKVDGSGNKMWDKTFGGTEADYLYSVVQTPDRGYLLGGTSYSPASADKTAGKRGFTDFWIVKTTPDPAAGPMRVISFTLINADTNQDLMELRHGDMLDLATLPTANLNVRANVSPATVGSVVFHLDRDYRRIENILPYALFGDNYPEVTDYLPGQFPVGRHRLRATPYARTFGQGEAGETLDVYFTVVGSRVQSFTLINADTNQDVMELREGDVIDYALLGTRNINVRANTFPEQVGSVAFTLNRRHIRHENILPYALSGDNYPAVHDYHPYPLPVGNHTLRATSFSGRHGTGTRGGSLSVSFTVSDGMSASHTAAALDISGRESAVFPNPFTNKLTLQLGQAEGPVQVTLVDGLGRTVYQKERVEPAGAVELDLAGQQLPAGLYFLRLSTPSGSMQVLRLMKQ